MDTSARHRGFEIRVFPLLGELPKAIEPHLPVCLLCRCQLGPNIWSSPTTKSLDPIVVTALMVGFLGESHGPTTCGFSCNCPEPGALTTEASGQLIYGVIQTQHQHQVFSSFSIFELYLTHSCHHGSLCASQNSHFAFLQAPCFITIQYH